MKSGGGWVWVAVVGESSKVGVRGGSIFEEDGEILDLGSRLEIKSISTILFLHKN
jgi:hypothetical protein